MLERVNRIPLKEDEGDRDYYWDEERVLKPIFELRSDKYELTRHQEIDFPKIISEVLSRGKKKEKLDYLKKYAPGLATYVMQELKMDTELNEYWTFLQKIHDEDDAYEYWQYVHGKHLPELLAKRKAGKLHYGRCTFWLDRWCRQD